MFSEIKTLKVDNHALKNQVKEIKEAIQNLITEKVTYIRKTYNPSAWYKINWGKENILAKYYVVDFYDMNSKETMGQLKIDIVNIEEKKEC